MAPVLTVLTLLVGTPCEAQVRADLVFGTRIDAGTSQRGTATLPNGETREVVLRQSLRVPWLVAGIRASHVLYRNVALELGYTTAWINATVDDLGGGDTPVLPARNGMMHTFALRPLVEVGRIGIASAGHVFAGPVMVWRTGEAFEDYSGTLRGGWSLGLGATLRTRRLHFRADLEDVIYPLELRRAGVITTQRRIHHNLSITVGIALLHGRIPPRELRK